MNQELLQLYLGMLINGEFTTGYLSVLKMYEPRYMRMVELENLLEVPRTRTKELQAALKITQSPLMEELK